MHDGSGRRRSAPIIAAGLALAYPVAVAAGAWALAGVTVAAAVAGCAAVLTRRPSARLRIALAAIAVWLSLGIGGAFLLQARTAGGFAWVLLVLYFLPLPAIPWLYAATFEGSPTAEGKRSGGAEEPEAKRAKTVSISSAPLLLGSPAVPSSSAPAEHVSGRAPDPWGQQ